MEDIELQPITTEQKTSSLTKEDKLNQQVEQLKGTMNNNVNQVLQNINLTNNLEQQTEEMRGYSKEFSLRSKHIKRRIWYKNFRINICISLIVISVFYYIYDSVK